MVHERIGRLEAQRGLEVGLRLGNAGSRASARAVASCASASVESSVSARRALALSSAHSGAGDLLVQPQAGRSVCAIAYDHGYNRLFIAGSITGQAYVYDAATGATLAVYQLADPAAGPTTLLNTGIVGRVDPATGQARTIDLGGGSVPVSDGLALVGQKLYVSLVVASQIAVVDLNADFTSGVIEGQTLQSTALDFQSKIATFGNAVYAVNAHFELDPAPDVAYQVVRLSR